MQRDFLQIVLDDQLRSLFRVLNFQKLKVIPELKMCVVVVDGIGVCDDTAIRCLAENSL